ncbi:MAG: hypothetical protein ACO259_10770, partial [Bacteroidia bacterium]
SIQKWCAKNKIGFFGTYNPIQNSNFSKLIKLTIFELVESIDYLTQLDDKLRSRGQQLFYITDNLINRSLTANLTNIKIIPTVELFGMISTVDVDKKVKKPEKLFNCFIQRVDSVRQTWFYFLKHYNLLDKGYVSFLLFQYKFYSDKTGVELFDYNHSHFNLNKLPHFDDAYNALRPIVPYNNFPRDSDLSAYVNDSKYSLVLETYATSDEHLGYCYTEKIHRALQSPTINLFFSQQHSLSALANIGFKLDDWMLEIDKLPWIQRQQRLLDILVNDPVAYDAELLYNNAVNNRDLIAGFKKQFLNGAFLDKILTEIYEA